MWPVFHVQWWADNKSSVTILNGEVTIVWPVFYIRWWTDNKTNVSIFDSEVTIIWPVFCVRSEESDQSFVLSYSS